MTFAKACNCDKLYFNSAYDKLGFNTNKKMPHLSVDVFLLIGAWMFFGGSRK